jgi:hypothetical protein
MTQREERPMSASLKHPSLKHQGCGEEESPSGAKAHINFCTLYAALEGPLFHGEACVWECS